MKRQLHLICNAHIDPVWLWEWPEGLAETLSTFRIAADFCESTDGFIFNHNEALLYRWIEEYDPPLFSRIRKLVKSGRWHIMGGWMVQPDCNMVSGEALVRQVLKGRHYFASRFGKVPRTAMNFDPFGHSRGLVQILVKSGYDSYLFCRPDRIFLSLPDDDFIWVGYDGSCITAHRAPDHYNSRRGEAALRIKKFIDERTDRKGNGPGLLLWGIGNHGGGPSAEDLAGIQSVMESGTGWTVQHSTPEGYFADLRKSSRKLKNHCGDLNPWAPGCYTSMQRVKQQYRKLENRYVMTEKMCTQAVIAGLMKMPKAILDEALDDLLFCQFHDILPGSSIEEVEAYALQRLGHGLKLCEQLKVKAFFHLAAGQAPAAEAFPVLIYNPHPFTAEQIVECELQPQEPNFSGRERFEVTVTDASGRAVDCQVEKEASNLNQDFRKKVVFTARMAPGEMNRYSCRFRLTGKSEENAPRRSPQAMRWENGDAAFTIDGRSGLLAGYRIKGEEYLGGTMVFQALEDNEDPWAMNSRGFQGKTEDFKLMTPEEAGAFCGMVRSLSPVHVIESGPVRTVVESLLKFNRSVLIIRTAIPAKGSEVALSARVFWNEASRMLKMVLPTPFKKGTALAQVVMGAEPVISGPDEHVMQQWAGIWSENGGYALTVINESTYGFDFSDGVMRISMLRSPAFSCIPETGSGKAVPDDRYEPRIDQGLHGFRFWINGGEADERLKSIDREALLKNEAVPVIPFFPSGTGLKPGCTVRLSNSNLRMTAMKLSERGDRLIIRLFEPAGIRAGTKVIIPPLETVFTTGLEPFEIKTLSVDLKTGAVVETDLMEGQWVKKR